MIVTMSSTVGPKVYFKTSLIRPPHRDDYVLNIVVRSTTVLRSSVLVL